MGRVTWQMLLLFGDVSSCFVTKLVETIMFFIELYLFVWLVSNTECLFIFPPIGYDHRRAESTVEEAA